MGRSIGKQLYEQRLTRGLSLDDVQHRTRIPRSRLAEMENDDYSNFPSLTYAKSFLALYSRYLDLDISEFLLEFQLDGLDNPNRYSYLRPSREILTRRSHRPLRVPPASPRLALAWIAIVLAGLIGFAIWFGNQSTRAAANATARPAEPATEPSIETGAGPPAPRDRNFARPAVAAAADSPRERDPSRLRRTMADAGSGGPLPAARAEPAGNSQNDSRSVEIRRATALLFDDGIDPPSGSDPGRPE